VRQVGSASMPACGRSHQAIDLAVSIPGRDVEDGTPWTGLGILEH
jgi:hypothetical protein